MNSINIWRNRVDDLERELAARNETVRTLASDVERLLEDDEATGDALDDVCPGWEGDYPDAIRALGAEKDKRIAELTALIQNTFWHFRCVVDIDCCQEFRKIVKQYFRMPDELPIGDMAREALTAHDAALVGPLVEAFAEYRQWFDTCTKTNAPNWEERAALASERLDAALAPYKARTEPPCPTCNGTKIVHEDGRWNYIRQCNADIDVPCPDCAGGKKE